MTEKEEWCEELLQTGTQQPQDASNFMAQANEDTVRNQAARHYRAWAEAHGQQAQQHDIQQFAEHMVGVKRTLWAHGRGELDDIDWSKAIDDWHHAPHDSSSEQLSQSSEQLSQSSYC